jgi:thioredoxin-like negative regulator of GroEL
MQGPEAAERAALIHREVTRLGVLILVAVAAFFLTRAIAANNRDLNLRHAAEWYGRGQASMQAGDLGGAIDAFRHATVRSRNNTTYQLALARALILAHEYDAARAVLAAVRASAAERGIGGRCEPATDLDLTLQLIACEHGADGK